MKALTISQPYASLIASGEKFVENRTWETFHRGPLAIHAGKGKQYLGTKELAKYPTGCIVAVCRLLECVHVPSLGERIQRNQPYRNLTMTWMHAIRDHEHTEGPFGFVLSEIRALPEPVPYQGAQGLWVLPDDVLPVEFRGRD